MADACLPTDAKTNTQSGTNIAVRCCPHVSTDEPKLVIAKEASGTVSQLQQTKKAINSCLGRGRDIETFLLMLLIYLTGVDGRCSVLLRGRNSLRVVLPFDKQGFISVIFIFCL